MHLPVKVITWEVNHARHKYLAINMHSVELGYYYLSKFQEELTPIFVFRGSGTVDIAEETYDTDYVVYGNAVPLD